MSEGEGVNVSNGEGFYIGCVNASLVVGQDSVKVPLNKGGQRFRRNRAGVVVLPVGEYARTTPKACGLCPLF